jgi:tetratricopeptide (TPR) repeat protein
MEAILDNLCKIADLNVKPRTSVEQYRNTVKSIPRISKEMRASYLVEGSGQKNGDNIRITIKLTDGLRDKQIWSHPYDKKIKDIFNLQSEIAQTLASEIKAIITPDEKKLIEKSPTVSTTAWNLYLKGNDLLKALDKTRDSITYQKTINIFHEALKIDPTFAKAYTGLAKAYYTRYYWPSYYKENFLDSCLILSNQAIEYDKQLDEAYYIKGQYYRQKGQIDEALINFDKAIKINPNYFLAYYDKGAVLARVSNDYVSTLDMLHKALKLIGGDERPALLTAIGRAYGEVGFIEEAYKYFHEAYDLDPDSAANKRVLAYLSFCNGNFEEALKQAEEAEKIDPENLFDQYYYCVVSGHEKEALEHAKRLTAYFKKKGEKDIRNSFRVGYAFYNMGYYKEAESFIKKQIEYSEESIKQNKYDAQSKQSQLTLAFTYAFKGDKEKAYKYLDELNTSNFFPRQRLVLIKNDLMGARINKEERFQKIVKEMEAKYQAEHERVRKWLEENNML